MIQTFVCDTCKKAVDLTLANDVIFNPTRCIITKACRGTLSATNANSVSTEQYNVTTDMAWVQIPSLYEHDQIVSRKIWVVNHGLNARPMVQIYATGTTTPLATSNYTIAYTSGTSLVITFANATAGVAECQIRPNTLPVIPVTTTTSTATTLITPNSVLTLAILRTTFSFNLSTYVDSTTPASTSMLTVTSSDARIAGPWRNSINVIINGRRYYLVDIALSTVPAMTETVSTSFTILNTDGTSIVPGTAYVLLSNAPYQALADRILNSCLDVAALSNKEDTVYDSENLFCLETSLQPLYPTIISL